MTSQFRQSSTQLLAPQTNHNLKAEKASFANIARCAAWLKITLSLSLLGLLYISSIALFQFEQMFDRSLLLSPLFIASITSFILCFYFFTRWAYRASVNASLLVPHRELHKPRFLIISLFIPFVNFMAPCAFFLEISSASTKAKTYKELIATWWFAWLIFLASASTIYLPLKQKITEIAVCGIVAGGIIAHLALFLIINIITTNQIRRRNRIN